MSLEAGRRALKLYLVFVLLLLGAVSLPAWAAEKMRFRVDDYQIEAELNPHAHKLTARAKVKFTALEDLTLASFELNNGLRVTKVLDANNKPLSAERVTQDSSVRVPLPSGLTKNSSTTLTFDYQGTISAGPFREFKGGDAGLDLHVFFKPVHQAMGAEYSSTAIKEFTYFVTLYGSAPSPTLKVVEIPDDSAPAGWAPEIAAIS